MVELNGYYLKNIKKREEQGFELFEAEVWKDNERVGFWKQNEVDSVFDSEILEKDDIKSECDKANEKFPQLFNIESKKEESGKIENTWEDFFIALMDLKELKDFYEKHKQKNNQVVYFYINGNEIYRGVVADKNKDKLYEYFKEQRKERHKSNFKKEDILILDQFEL